MTGITAYGSLANTLDSPTIVIPVTTASSQVDTFDHDYKPMSEKDRKNWLACAHLLIGSFTVSES
jgi:hypothetical protein